MIMSPVKVMTPGKVVGRGQVKYECMCMHTFSPPFLLFFSSFLLSSQSLVSSQHVHTPPPSSSAPLVFPSFPFLLHLKIAVHLCDQSMFFQPPSHSFCQQLGQLKARAEEKTKAGVHARERMCVRASVMHEKTRPVMVTRSTSISSGDACFSSQSWILLHLCCVFTPMCLFGSKTNKQISQMLQIHAEVMTQIPLIEAHCLEC